MAGLPQDVRHIIKEFTHGWQPTPSAAALQKVIRRDKGQVSFFDARARARCQTCEASVCCARWWRIDGDGSVYMLYHAPSAHCLDCQGPEDEVEESEVCQTMSRKSTWETLWESSTGQYYHAFRKGELRAYVLKRLRTHVLPKERGF